MNTITEGKVITVMDYEQWEAEHARRKREKRAEFIEDVKLTLVLTGLLVAAVWPFYWELSEGNAMNSIIIGKFLVKRQTGFYLIYDMSGKFLQSCDCGELRLTLAELEEGENYEKIHNI